MRKNILLIFVIIMFLPASQLYAETYRELKLQPRSRSQHQKTDKVQLKLNELSRELNLSAEQAAKVKGILLKSQEDTGKILKDAKEVLKNTRVKANDEIAALLDDAQKAKFKRIRRKHEMVLRLEE